MVRYNIGSDLDSIKALLRYSDAELSAELGVSEMTIGRWRECDLKISENHIRSIYDYAYSQGIRLNGIKEQLYKEEFTNADTIVLFHGAKYEITGDLSIEYSQDGKDFGRGFYCGESFLQSSMFVSTYSNSSVYIVKFNKTNELKSHRYMVDRDWLLTIANCRGRLQEYAGSEIIQNLMNQLHDCDYVVAPIADNRMFQLIDEFAEGTITDVQCQHALSATDLGMQYVFLTDKALSNVELLTRCYLPDAEKNDYLNAKTESNKIAMDKVKLARRNYRNEGLYIDQIL